jgi:proteic killer suppression protein
MDISFRNRRIEKICTSEKEMRKSLPSNRERVLKIRLRQLSESPTLESLRNQPGNCHELAQERDGQPAVSLDGLFRLVFEPAEPIPRKPDGGLDWSNVIAVEIVEIVDYHF